MSLKTFKSYTKSSRGTVLVDRRDLWKGKSFKSLSFGKTSTGGRNNLGRITSRSKGAGHKKNIDWSIFTERKMMSKLKLKELNMIPIEQLTLL